MNNHFSRNFLVVETIPIQVLMAETFPILEFQKFKTMSDKTWFGIFIERENSEKIR